MPKFETGAVVATPAAIDMLERENLDPIQFLSRHMTGDWGDIDEHDKAVNAEALQDDGRLFSSYDTPGGKLWIITEADRSATTLLTPADY
jgi:hypothetical protein